MMERIIYFSGVHGSGKTTLIDRLCNDDENFILCPKVEGNGVKQMELISERQRVRICRYFLQTFNAIAMEEEHADKYVVCDRSVHDLAYLHGFLKIGWISHSEFDRTERIKKLLFEEKYLPKNLVYLNPPLDFVKERIQERWKKTSEVKWNEDNFDYLNAVYESFQKLFPSIKCNKLEVTETDLDKRVDRVYEWLKIQKAL